MVFLREDTLLQEGLLVLDPARASTARLSLRECGLNLIFQVRSSPFVQHVSADCMEYDHAMSVQKQKMIAQGHSLRL